MTLQRQEREKEGQAPLRDMPLSVLRLNLEEPEPGTPATTSWRMRTAPGACKDYENTRLWYDTMFDGSDLVISDLVMGDYCSSGANLERHSEMFRASVTWDLIPQGEGEPQQRHTN